MLDDGRTFASDASFSNIEEAYESAAGRAVSALQREVSLKSVLQPQSGFYPKGTQPGSYDGGRNGAQQGFYQAGKVKTVTNLPLSYRHHNFQEN